MKLVLSSSSSLPDERSDYGTFEFFRVVVRPFLFFRPFDDDDDDDDDDDNDDDNDNDDNLMDD
eukprot:jgi/Psemu1/58680/gm1.58680_g